MSVIIFYEYHRIVTNGVNRQAAKCAARKIAIFRGALESIESNGKITIQILQYHFGSGKFTCVFS